MIVYFLMLQVKFITEETLHMSFSIQKELIMDVQAQIQVASLILLVFNTESNAISPYPILGLENFFEHPFPSFAKPAPNPNIWKPKKPKIPNSWLREKTGGGNSDNDNSWRLPKPGVDDFDPVNPHDPYKPTIPREWLRGRSAYDIPGLENILNNPNIDPSFARPSKPSPWKPTWNPRPSKPKIPDSWLRGRSNYDIPGLEDIFNNPNIDPSFARPSKPSPWKPTWNPRPSKPKIPDSWLREKSNYDIPGLGDIFNNPNIDPGFARPVGKPRPWLPTWRPDKDNSRIPQSWLRG